jgi:hypothetical protein
MNMFGVKLSDITEVLHPIEDEVENKEPIHSIKNLAEKLEPFIPALQEYCYKHPLQEFYKEWYHWNPKYFANFSFEDILRCWYACPIQSRFHHHFDSSCFLDEDDERSDSYKMRHWRLASHLHRSMWRFGGYAKDWSWFSACYNAINHFDFGIPGFDVTLDWVTGYGPKGWSEFSPTAKADESQTRVYLDGFFGYHIWYKSKRVLTIGFSFSKDAVLVHQIQGGQKKGNRWLYKLPKHYFDYAVERMTACYDIPVRLIDAKDCANRVRACYGSQATELFKQESWEHIRALYSRPLAGFRRYSRKRYSDAHYYTLVPRAVVGPAVLKAVCTN